MAYNILEECLRTPLLDIGSFLQLGQKASHRAISYIAFQLPQSSLLLIELGVKPMRYVIYIISRKVK